MSKFDNLSPHMVIALAVAVAIGLAFLAFEILLNAFGG